MRTQRFEYKYLITEAVARRVREAVMPFVRPDPHAARRPGYTYPISSLYLDSANLRLYRETLEGRRDRFKLRVRAYSDDPSIPLFAEIKRRTDKIIHKTRAKIGRAELAAFVLGHRTANSQSNGAGQEFSGLALRVGARPKVIVRYDREAYVGTADPEVRVTFDRGLRAVPERNGRLQVDRPDFRVVPVRMVVLEIKFNRRIPFWLPPLVARLELRRRSFSKYAHAVQAAVGGLAAFSA